MKINVTETYEIKLEEVFVPVVFETHKGEKLTVCMRDGSFEIGIKDQSIKSKEEYYNHYSITNGIIEPLKLIKQSNVLERE